MLIFLIARLSVSPTCKKRHHLGFLLRNASHIFNSFSSIVKSSESSLPKANQEEGHESLTFSYLVNSCGLSPKVALRIESTHRLKLKDLDKADSVLDILRSYGFSETQISKAVRYLPALLRMNPKILLPKLRFLESFGFSRSKLPEILSHNSLVLRWNLEKRLIPHCEALKSALDNDFEKLSVAIRRSGWVFLQQDVTNIVTNMKVLREHGMPKSRVTQLITSYSGLAFMQPAKFAEHVNFAIEIGMEPFRITFLQAIYVLAATRKSTWKSKLDAFERWGWSKDMTLSVFRKYPLCMTLSEDRIMESMKFLVDEMCLAFEDVAACPSLLGYSLKKRIVPRWSVVKILKKNGLLKKNVKPRTIFVTSEKQFLKQFVVRFQGSCPQLLSIYKDSIAASVPKVP